MSSPSSTALLIDPPPKMKCAVIVNTKGKKSTLGDVSIVGSIALTLKDCGDGKPDIHTLSILKRKKKHDEEEDVNDDENIFGDEDFVEEALFEKKTQQENKDSDAPVADRYYDPIRTATSDLGEALLERLSDAASSSSSSSSSRPIITSWDGPNNEGRRRKRAWENVEEFLTRSEGVVNEFFSAMEQHSLRKDGRKQQQQQRRRRVGNHKVSSAPPTRFYSAMLTQLSQIQDMIDEGKIGDDDNDDSFTVTNVEVDDALTSVVITCADGSRRTHDLHVAIDPLSFPMRCPVFTTDLPPVLEARGSSENSTAAFNPHWRSGTIESRRLDSENDINDDEGGSPKKQQEHESSSRYNHGLPRIIATDFRSILSQYQPLWNELDDIDTNAWVLDPPLPARRACIERRLAIRGIDADAGGGGGAMSVVMTLDPEHPRSSPVSVRLVGGPSSDLADLRSRYRKYIAGTLPSDDKKKEGEFMGWSDELSVRTNLSRFLGYDLPSPETTDKNDFVAECGVCYSYRLMLEEEEEEGNGGEKVSRSIIPEANCSNANCARVYHESCLFEWLHSLPTARIGFDRVYGTCPYCCEAISVRTPSNRMEGGAR